MKGFNEAILLSHEIPLRCSANPYQSTETIELTPSFLLHNTCEQLE